VVVTIEHVKALVRRHLDGDDEGFLTVARQLAARAARDGDVEFARELQELIDAGRTKPVVARLKPTPMALPRGELAGLMSVTYPDLPLDAMVLDESVLAKLKRVVTEQRQRDRLEGHGLEPIHRVLLFGPPGTGKSMAAAALSRELHLPMFSIQLDALMSKFMGETATKLRVIFDAVSTTRAVYLFDEFDALGGHRTASNDVGEARRVLNSFLQFLEEASPASLIVAATNHPQLLDKALFRRFDQVIEFGYPNASQATEVIRERLSLLDMTGIDWEGVGHASAGLSHSEITRAAEAAAKHALLVGRERLTTNGLLAALRERRRQVDE
jgi:SpoVK/Ycf46/Vps4 family AAA+-type ATPase